MPVHKEDPAAFELTKDGVVYDGPPGDLETLLSSKAILSESFDISYGDDKVRGRWRELSNSQKQAIQAFAIQWFEDKRRQQEEDGKGEWRDAESDRDVMIGEERHLRMLQASLIQADSYAPAISLGWMRKRMGTQLETMLGNRYHAFEASIDPVNVDEEVIEQVLQDCRDNFPFDYLLTQYDIITLVRSLQLLVNLHWPSQIEESSGGQSDDLQH